LKQNRTNRFPGSHGLDLVPRASSGLPGPDRALAKKALKIELHNYDFRLGTLPGHFRSASCCNSLWPPFQQHKNRIALSQNGDLLPILSDDLRNICRLAKIQ
jgi:hypothetical protein